MKENKNMIVSVENDQFVTVEDNLFQEDYSDREGFKLIKDVVAVAKMDATIAKKETDAYVHLTKVNADTEKAFIDSLIKDKERENISAEDLANINQQIVDANIRLSRLTSENVEYIEKSPYHRSINLKKIAIWGTVILVSGLTGVGIYKYAKIA